MGIRRGSISTPIIADGLVFNMDAANRASYTFYTANSSSYNTVDTTQEGTLTNGVGFLSPPLSASCWSFDNVDDYIIMDATLGNYLGTVGTGSAFTGLAASMWFKCNCNENGAIFGFEDAGSYGKFSASFWNSTLRFSIKENTFRKTVSFTDSTSWHNLVIVSSFTTETTKMYLDGVSVGSDTGTVPGSISLSSRTLYIGWHWSNSHTFDGLISNAQLYDRALSANEVLHNYNALKGRFA